MTTIGLKVSAGKVVVAFDPNNSGPGQHGGNVDAQSGDTLRWQCANNGHSFLVRFRDFRSAVPIWIWPFSEPADLVVPDPDPTRPAMHYLRVDSMNAKARTFNYTLPVKYEVAVETGPAAESLDPVIIIRPAQISTDSVLFGVTCAVVGAIAGAVGMAVLS